jgi:hypothetical protein
VSQELLVGKSLDWESIVSSQNRESGVQRRERRHCDPKRYEEEAIKG